MDINSNNGWFFQNPQSNRINILTDKEIEELFILSEQEEKWVSNVRKDVLYRDEHPSFTGADFIFDEARIINTGGTVIRYPFNKTAITFPSRRHIFRGEPKVYPESIPSLNRKIKDKKKSERLLLRAIAEMRTIQFYKFIWKINVVPYWEAKISDINYKALAQHYGFDTSLLDLTNDIRVALFFATCKYIPETDSYRPLTEKECDERKYGVIFHTPDWMIDVLNGANLLKLTEKMGPRMDQPLYIESGDCDGIAFQIGLQPLMRCHYQSGYILPMIFDVPLQNNWIYEKMHIKLTKKLSETVFEMMDSGKKVFPNEGITEAREILDRIKRNVLFSENDLLCAYYSIGSTAFSSLNEFKKALESMDEKIYFKKEEIDYDIPCEILKSINDKYDGKDLLETIGGVIHIKPEEQKFRDQRCIEIFGKLI